MMNNKFKVVLLVLVFGVLLISGCNEDNDNDPEGKFQLGILLPLTGAASSPGESAAAAIDLAIEDINDYLDATGNDLAIELVIKDTGTNPDTALQRMHELNNADVKFVIGPFTSTNAEAVLPFANENDMVLLSPSSVATTLAISGDNLYRLLPSDKAQAEAMAALFKYDSIETIIPVVRNDVWGGGLISDVIDLFITLDLHLENVIFYDPLNFNSNDIATEIANAINVAQNQTPASQIGVYLLSFAEGTEILNAASLVPGNEFVKWYGSSAYSNNGSLLQSGSAAEFAIQQSFKSPSFAPDPSVIDLWNPVNDKLTTQLGRTPEVFALTSYDAVWMMVLSYMQAENPDDLTQFKSSLEHLTQYYNGITGRTTLDANGDRKYASFNFWGVEKQGSEYEWKSFGYYRNADGLLLIY